MRGKLLLVSVAAVLMQAAPASAGVLGTSADCPQPESVFGYKANGTSGCQVTVAGSTVTVDRCETEGETWEFSGYSSESCTTGVDDFTYECDSYEYSSGRSGDIEQYSCSMEASEAGVTVAQSCETDDRTYEYVHTDGCTADVAGPATVSCTYDPYVRAFGYDDVAVDPSPDAPACDVP